MKCRANLSLVFVAGLIFVEGCASITAVNLNDPKAPEGIPYYLPKPYLFISKNIRYIPTPTVGLTEVVAAPAPPASSPSTTKPGKTSQGGPEQSGGSDQSNDGKPSQGAMSMNNSSDAGPLSDPGVRRYAAQVASAVLASDGGGPPTPSTGGKNDDDKTNSPNPQQPTSLSSQVTGPPSVTVVPAASIPDEMHPETFFTYQIVYLPDLTQKYGLRVNGGAGDLRQTMNLVNGWMYTGAGPMYSTDSTSADDVTSVGNGLGQIAEDIIKAIVPGSTGTSAPAKSGTMKPQDYWAVPSTQRAPTTQGETGTFNDYSELYVYEPAIKVDPTTKAKSVTWHLVHGFPLTFSREYISTTDDSSKSQ